MAWALGLRRPAKGVHGLLSRRVALDLVFTTLRQRRTLDSQLDKLKSLTPRDQAFARALASQTMRHLGALEAVIGRFLHKPLPPHKCGAAQEILLTGACELLVLKTAPHASVYGANELAAKDANAVHFRGVINAVLHRIASQGENAVNALDYPQAATPDWLWQRWCKQYGPDAARAIAQAHLRQAPTDIVLKSPRSEHPQSCNLFGAVERLGEAAHIQSLQGFCQGDWWVQDAASSLPSLLLGDVAGRKVIDLCAAPGGKTMQLSAMGADVIAVERDLERAERLRQNLLRTKLGAEIVIADARDVQMKAPLVLVDAPCSATGTIRRHPELPWIKNAADVMQSAALAYEILENAAQLVEKDGLLVFCVCSLEREESEEQIAVFLDAHRDFIRVPIGPEEVFSHHAWITKDGALRTLPSYLGEQGGMDGFYAARLRRLT